MRLLESNPLLLLFLVAAVGYWLGQIRLGTNSLGVAAVLFVGLAFGALDPDLSMPDSYLNLGLVLFVYTIGLANGPGFFAKFRREGLREVLFIVGSLLLPVLLLLPLALSLGMSAAETAGVFTGQATNTPALASVLDYLQNTGSGANTAVSAAVVGFSVVYPLGVLGRMIVLAFTARRWRIDFAAEAYALRHQYPIAKNLGYRTIIVKRENAVDTPLRRLQRGQQWDVVFGRIYRQNEIGLIGGDTRFQPGDRLVIAGTQEEMDRVTEFFGETAVDNLLHDHAVYDSRWLFVSNPAIAGQRLATLNLKERHGAIVSHVRRGDVALLANDRTVLELGDRIRLLAPRDEMDHLIQKFGDSYTSLSQVNLLTLGLGVTLGLLLGLVPIPLPGGITFRLGLAGGPLLVALVLGALRRTGPVLWTLPYSANLTLRQVGLILLLASIGVRSGSDLLAAFTDGRGWLIMGVGAAIIILTTWASLLVGYRLLHIPYSLLIGMISPQPAVLSFAEELAKNPLPGAGFTLMFPFAIIINVTVAQILIIALQNLG